MKFIKQTVRQKYYLVFLLFVMPSVIFAADTTLNDIEVAALDLLNSVVPMLIAAAVAFFLWSVLKYINSGDNAEARIQARALMIYGIIAIFVMVSLWGFVNVLVETFNLEESIPVDFNDIILEIPGP